MSDADGKNPEFDDLELPEGDLNLPEGDLAPLGDPDETMEFEPPADAQQPVDDLLDQGDELTAPDAADEAAALVEDGGLLDADLDAVSEDDAAGMEELPEETEEEEKKEKRPGLGSRVRATSPYVVLLGISLLAIVIGILCLFMEFQRYGFQVKPTQAHAAPMVQSGPLTTTAAT